MSTEQLFEICNTIALISWIILAFFTFWKARTRYLLGIVVLLLAIVYAWLALSSLKPQDMQSFGSLEGIKGLFQDSRALLAGWVHYLAFDLLAGIYIVERWRRLDINHWFSLPILFLTFMLGPVGFLLFLLVRLVKTRSLVSEVI